MLLPNKTVLFPRLSYVQNYLKTNTIPKSGNTFCDIYSDKIVVNHFMINENMYCIRMWKTKTLFNYWYNDMCSSKSKFIAALDYKIHPEHIKIEYMNLNDDEYVGISADKPALSKSESSMLNKSLLLYTKEIARNTNKKKVIVDVHSNLRIYNNYYYEEGFQATTRKCKDNPYWVEAEYIVE